MSRRRLAAILGLLTLTGCGSDSGEDRPARDPFVEVGRRQSRPEPAHAAPRWQRVASFTGSGTAVRRLEVRDDALQWRLTWRCRSGSLAVLAGRTAARLERLAAERCPARGRATSLSHGRLDLRVRASGSWRITIEQQIDSPLHEPRLAAMTAPGARPILRGSFYGIERKGSGDAVLYRLPEGRLALRLERFATTTNTDLVVWLSGLRRPRTSVQAFRSRSTEIAPLKSTMGEQNYVLPRDLPARHLRSIVIWCVPERIAYAAATLRGA